MSHKDDLTRAGAALKGLPIFSDFMKTLAARRESIVAKLIDSQDPNQVDVLRGEVRGYDFIIKAVNNSETQS